MYFYKCWDKPNQETFEDIVLGEEESPFELFNSPQIEYWGHIKDKTGEIDLYFVNDEYDDD